MRLQALNKGRDEWPDADFRARCVELPAECVKVRRRRNRNFTERNGVDMGPNLQSSTPGFL